MRSEERREERVPSPVRFCYVPSREVLVVGYSDGTLLTSTQPPPRDRRRYEEIIQFKVLEMVILCCRVGAGPVLHLDYLPNWPVFGQQERNTALLCLTQDRCTLTWLHHQGGNLSLVDGRQDFT